MKIISMVLAVLVLAGCATPVDVAKLYPDSCTGMDMERAVNVLKQCLRPSEGAEGICDICLGHGASREQVCFDQADIRNTTVTRDKIVVRAYRRAPTVEGAQALLDADIDTRLHGGSRAVTYSFTKEYYDATFRIDKIEAVQYKKYDSPGDIGHSEEVKGNYLVILWCGSRFRGGDTLSFTVTTNELGNVLSALVKLVPNVKVEKFHL